MRKGKRALLQEKLMGYREKLVGVYYTAAEARKVLGLKDDEFQNWVKAGKVKRIEIPGRKQGVYSKHGIDLLAARIEAAVLAAREPEVRFAKAIVEEQWKEFELAVLNFGEGSSRFNEKRRELLEKNPDMSYYLYDGDVMVGSINMVPIDADGIAQFKVGERGWLLGEHVIGFEPGHTLDVIVIDMLTTPLAPSTRRMHYAMHLLFGLAEHLLVWGSQGIEIAHVYACGGTPQGRRILTTAGFTYTGEPRPGRFMYTLDVSASKLNILEPYKSALGDYKRKHVGE
jgi:hypothetical protein